MNRHLESISHLAVQLPAQDSHRFGKASYGSRKNRSLFMALMICFLVGFTLLHGWHRTLSALTNLVRKPQSEVSCLVDAVGIASRHRLKTPFQYSRRIIQAKPLELEESPRHTRPTPHRIGGDLIPGWALLPSEDTDSMICLASEEFMTLPIYTINAKTTASSLIVGMTSNVDRILLFLDLYAASFARTGVKVVFAVLPDARILYLKQELKSRGIDAIVMPVSVDSDPSQGPNYGKEEFMIRWTLLPQYLQQHMDTHHKWMYLADDDTVLLSLSKLLAMLDRYDVNGEHYIGALSDDWRMSWVGMFAYGGAGTVLSRPLVAKIVPHLATCATQHSRGGDERLAHCIYQHTTARLELELGLNQFDLHGSIQGLLEGSKELITLHHWKSDVTGFDSNFFSLLSNTTYGGQGFLQRYQAQSEPGSGVADLLLVRGVSITQFHGGQVPDLEKSELTWDYKGDDPTPFLHALGPLRSAVPTTSSQQEIWKQVWTLEDIGIDEVGNVRELYINRDEAGVDSVIELVWIEGAKRTKNTRA